MRVSSTEIQNNFGKYLRFAGNEEIIVTRKGKAVAKLSGYRDLQNGIVAEEAAEYAIDYQKRYKEYLELVENSDERYEFIDGEIIKLASPTYKHQVIVTEFLVLLHQWFKGKKCRPLTAPFDVTLFKYEDLPNVVQPDIVVICDTDKVNEKGKYKGVPALIVEVLSESTKKYDMLMKLDVYMQGGVCEYWIVNPDKMEVYIYSFKESNIEDYRVCRKDDTIVSSAFKNLEISFGEVFADSDN
jgi:prevent-host-death family protein